MRPYTLSSRCASLPPISKPSKQADLVRAVKNAQRLNCAYDYGDLEKKAPSMCDCKYGADRMSRNFGGEEGNGRPELREAAVLLAELTPEEYQNLCDRATATAYRMWRP